MPHVKCPDCKGDGTIEIEGSKQKCLLCGGKELEQLTETENFCYTVQKRSWPPSGVSYDYVRKTRIYRLY
jgi:hypothetical protein